MIKKTSKKLPLRGESVRTLSHLNLEAVIGGADTDPDFGCTKVKSTCNRPD